MSLTIKGDPIISMITFNFTGKAVFMYKNKHKNCILYRNNVLYSRYYSQENSSYILQENVIRIFSITTFVTCFLSSQLKSSAQTLKNSLDGLKSLNNIVQRKIDKTITLQPFLFKVKVLQIDEEENCRQHSNVCLFYSQHQNRS